MCHSISFVWSVLKISNLLNMLSVKNKGFLGLVLYHNPSPDCLVHSVIHQVVEHKHIPNNQASHNYIDSKSVFRLAEGGLGLDITTECKFKNKIYAIDKPLTLGVLLK